MLDLNLLENLSDKDLLTIEQDKELSKRIFSHQQLIKNKSIEQNITYKQVFKISSQLIKKINLNNENSSNELEQIENLLINIDSEIKIQAKKVQFLKQTLNGEKYFTWIGKDISSPISLVSITFHNDNMSAQIDSLSNSYSIKPIGNGFHIVDQFSENYQEGHNKKEYKDTIDITPEIEQLLKNNKTKLTTKFAGKYTANNTIANAEDGSFIDLMIVYTTSVKNASSDITSEIINDVQYANQVLAQSCAQFRLRLVYSGEVSYTETNNSSLDLLRLAAYGESRNYMDEVHDLRANYGADLVQLWVENNTDVCGIGFYILSPEYGFSLVIRSCTPTSSIHEIGHNLSLSHDRYEEGISFYDIDAPNQMAYGYTNTAMKVRDIMAYNSECSNAGLYCPRIPYFSTPRVRYQGLPIGITNIADSVSRVNETRVTVANYVAASTPYTVDTSSGCLADSTEEKGIMASSPCFVATAAYGSYLDPHVQTLREFRNLILKKTHLGQMFIVFYENNSPTLAHLIQNNLLLKTITRIILTPIVFATIPIVNLVKYPLLLKSLKYILFSTLLMFVFFLLQLHKKSKKKTFRFFLFLLLLFSFTLILTFPFTNSFAQIASPPIDPTQKSINPAVIAFSSGGKIATKISQGRKDFTFGSLERESEETNASNILFSYNLKGLALEGSSLLEKKSDREEKIQNYTLKSTRKDNEYSINLAYRLFSFLSLGFNFAQDKEKTLAIEKKNQKIGTGVTLYLLNHFYIGFGGNYIKNQQSNTSDNSWSDLFAGMGIVFRPASHTFRIEGAYVHSPESVVAANQPNGSNYHQKTPAIVMSADALFISNLFTKLTMGSVNGIALGISQVSSEKYPIGTSNYSNNNLKESCSTTSGYVMLVAMNRHIYIGPTVSISKNKIEENRTKEQLIALNIGIKF
ncbi:MAG: hypothetical protein HQK51_18380 [Oligoflexia bacterium]|nr:hypothetical protein [Oligoflexia bacterium]